MRACTTTDGEAPVVIAKFCDVSHVIQKPTSLLVQSVIQLEDLEDPHKVFWGPTRRLGDVSLNIPWTMATISRACPRRVKRLSLCLSSLTSNARPLVRRVFTWSALWSWKKPVVDEAESFFAYTSGRWLYNEAQRTWALFAEELKTTLHYP